MEFIPEILIADDGDCDITNAFCFSTDAVYIVINATSEAQELEACVFLKVNLKHDPLTYEVLHEFNSHALDYHAETPDLHYILSSGGYIHLIRNREITHYPFASVAFLPNIIRYDEESVVVFGDNGLAFLFRDGAYTPVPTPVTTTIHAMLFQGFGRGVAAGDFGVYLTGTVAGFTVQDISGSESIRALSIAPDGAVLLACSGGIGLVVRQDEILRCEGNEADFYSVTVFRGIEYWGDDNFGVYRRDGAAFVPAFETGYAFKMNTTSTLMTINAGYAVYIFDGLDWIHLKLNTTSDRLVERAPLDFTPP